MLLAPCYGWGQHSKLDSLSFWNINIPHRPITSRTGSEFVKIIQNMDIEQRELAIYDEIIRGNIPDFMRVAVRVNSLEKLANKDYEITLFVLPDYFSIGSNDDFVLMPMTPILAQQVMNHIGGTLPTRKMVDIIWIAAKIKLAPIPIPPSDSMATVVVFDRHNQLLKDQRVVLGWHFLSGTLVGGHKKDVIISNSLATHEKKVVIYGWHYQSGVAIQPMYKGHAIWYADYSHGIRGIASKCLVNGQSIDVHDILQDPILYKLLSDENQPMTITKYDTSTSRYPRK